MATKRDQIVRAWIDRESTKSNWISNVSYQGKRHELTTNSLLRQAALEFNRLHTIHLLLGKSETYTPEHQLELF